MTSSGLACTIFVVSCHGVPIRISAEWYLNVIGASTRLFGRHQASWAELPPITTDQNRVKIIQCFFVLKDLFLFMRLFKKVFFLNLKIILKKEKLEGILKISF